MTKQRAMKRVAPKSEQIQWLQYPISGNYCRTWTVAEALRELIANAIDSLAKVDLTYKDGQLTIRDHGEGFSTRSLVIGESEHGKTDQQIGQFGEGLKIAMLVLAKSNYYWRLTSTQFGIPEIRMRDNGLGVDTLEVGISQAPDCTQKKGTTVTVGCDTAAAAKAIKMFLALRKERWRGGTFKASLNAMEGYGENGIDLDSYHPPSAKKAPENGIFVNGLWTTTSDTLFSYNMRNQTAKDSMNRDRTRMGASEVEKLVEDQLQAAMRNHMRDERRNTVGRALLEALREDIDFQEVKLLKNRWDTPLKQEVLPFVREALGIPESLTTDKIALVLGDVTRAEVKELPPRFVAVEAHNKGDESLLRWLRDKCSYKTVGAVLRNISEERRRAAERKAENDAKTSEVLEGYLRLPEVDKDPFVFYDELVRSYSMLCFQSYMIEGGRGTSLEHIPVFVFDDETIANENTQGVWLPKTKAIGLGKKLVTVPEWSRRQGSKKPQYRQVYKLTETLLHEYMHALSGARDGTREHFDAMSRWATALMYLHEALGFALYLRRDPNFLGKSRAPVTGIELPPPAFMADDRDEWTMEEIFQSIQSEDTGEGCINICSSSKFPELREANENDWMNVPMRCMVAIREGASPKTYSYRFFFAGINKNIDCPDTAMHRQLQTVEVSFSYKSKKTLTWKAQITYTQGYEAERSYAFKLSNVADREHSVFMPEIPPELDESVFGA